MGRAGDRQPQASRTSDAGMGGCLDWVLHTGSVRCAAISRCGCLDGDAWMEMLGWGCLDEDAATGDGAHAALSRGGDASQGSCQSLEPAVAEA